MILIMIRKITDLFPAWAILFSVWAYRCPQMFIPMKSFIVPLLGLVMFGMGATLTFDSFATVFKRPKIILLGTSLQFLLMPLIAWLISKALRLPPEFLIGMVIVGACPGGTASNVISYLAKANVALSISLTAVSTMLSFLATPALTWLYIGKSVPVPVYNMIISILKIVILPVVLGTGVNTIFGKRLNKIKHVFPLVSVLAIVVIIGIIVGLNKDNIASVGILLIIAVALHNILGFASGYWVAKGLRFSEKNSRTIAIEVGMQNSGLGVALAVKYFSVISALPGAIFSIWHNLAGSFLAGYWARKGDEQRQ